MNTVHIEPREVAHLIRATFPDYRGQKVRVQAVETLTIACLNWCGGTRYQYRACTLEGKPTGNADVGNHAAPWANPVEGKEVRVPAGFCIVGHVIFQGKDLGIYIWVNPADMPRYLTDGGEGLSESEKTMLKLIRSYIASYRREEASRLGIDASDYDELVASLKAKGLLSKQGGLTLAGKNAASNL